MRGDSSTNCATARVKKIIIVLKKIVLYFEMNFQKGAGGGEKERMNECTTWLFVGIDTRFTNGIFFVWLLNDGIVIIFLSDLEKSKIIYENVLRY